MTPVRAYTAAGRLYRKTKKVGEIPASSKIETRIAAGLFEFGWIQSTCLDDKPTDQRDLTLCDEMIVSLELLQYRVQSLFQIVHFCDLLLK